MRMKKYLLSPYLIVLLSMPVYGSSCKAVIKQIHDDIARYTDMTKDQPLAWKKLAWLLNQLGEPYTQSVLGHLYQWDQFSLLIRSDGLTLSLGPFPNKEDITPSLEKAVTVLGQPQKIFTENLSQYTWKCADGASLTTMITDSGSLLNISASTCLNPSNCHIQSTTFEKSELEKKVSQSSTAAANIDEQAMLKTIIEDYNNHYHESLQTESDLQTQLIEKYKNYYAHLRLCDTGSYSFAYVYPFTMSLVYPNATIQSMPSGHCAVQVAQKISDMGEIISRCQYTKEQLSLFTEKEAISAAKGETSYDSNHLTPLQQIQKAQCQMYMNGEKVEPF